MPKIGQERVKNVFRFLESLKVFTLDKLVSSLRCSTPTARLKLKQWKAYTSYNKNSRYYAMPTVPRFDENGLWHYEDISFSKYGNLRNTVIHLSNNSASGLSGSEMGDLVRLAPRSFLHHFRNVAGIHREKRHTYIETREKRQTEDIHTQRETNIHRENRQIEDSISRTSQE